MWPNNSSPRYIAKRIETRYPHKTNSQIFKTSLFIIAPPKRKQPKCPSTDQWINKMQCIHAMENYSAIKWMKFWYMPQYERTLRTLCYVKEARLKRPHTISFHFVWNVQNRRIHKWKVEKWLLGASGRENRKWLLIVMGFILGDEMFWNQIVVMVVQSCDYTKNH